MSSIEFSFDAPRHVGNEILGQLFEAQSWQPGLQQEIPGGATLTLDEMPMAKGIGGIPTILIGTLSVASGVAINILSNWLYDKFKGRSNVTVRINRRMVEMSPEGFSRVIEESIEINKRV